MQHIALVGDSIFDNGSYVPGGQPLIEQLQSRLDQGSRATLLAVDGAVTGNVAKQLKGLPADTTHIVVSAGGNNALHRTYILHAKASTAMETFKQLTVIRREFTTEYRDMLRDVATLKKPTLICTIYDSVPGLQAEATTALTIFNDVIIRAGIEFGVPILDLRFVCNEAKDYSPLSPIEPSEAGGSKIVRGILRVVQEHDYTRRESAIYK